MNRLIRQGSRSDEVLDVQTRLRALGFSVEDEPGWFGESTRAAVRAFQQRRSMLVDGIVGQSLRVLVLVTTNEPLRRLHPAVVRPGRTMQRSARV